MLISMFILYIYVGDLVCIRTIYKDVQNVQDMLQLI